MARKQQTADVDSLPLSLLPRFASNLFHIHICAFDASAENPTNSGLQYRGYQPLLSCILSPWIVRYFRSLSPLENVSSLYNRSDSILVNVNSRNSTGTVKYPKLTHRAPRSSDTVLFIFWCVFAPDFCAEVTHSLVDELRMYKTEERGLRVFIGLCISSARRDTKFLELGRI